MDFDNDDDNDCHPNVSLSDWKAFCNWASPCPFEKVLDRSDIALPYWYLPLARGAAFPSSNLLCRAGYRPGAHRARGWFKPSSEELWKDLGRNSLVVQKCGQFWRIGWDNGTLARPHNHSYFALVHHFGSTPIVTRTYQEATHLAEFCFEDNSLSAGLCWVHECPDAMDDAVEYAHRRLINETIAARSPRCNLAA
jgi:hypothetical protein